MTIKLPKTLLHKTIIFITPVFWFMVGFFFASATLVSLILIYFNISYKNRALPGIFVGNTYVGTMTKNQIDSLYEKKNEAIQQSSITFSYNNLVATASAKDLNIGYDADLLSTQAVILGKSGNIFTDFYMLVNSYMNGTNLPPAYTFKKDAIATLLNPIQKQVYVEPVDAQFVVENNRVTTFRQSSEGKTVDFQQAEQMLENKVPQLTASQKQTALQIPIPVKNLDPQTTTQEANNLGIVEEIGEGSSTYFGSDPNRVHNVALAATKMNGVIIAPNQTFSFDKVLGDVSKYTGYAQAYVIQNGRTVLGDGGGVCQVSTTLFRAVLNAGLPIVERHGHAYRVGYYEQNSPPGIDATIYVPTVDLKFKNDTGHSILIQSYVDTDNYALTFVLYGTNDGRTVTMTTPVITSQTPPPDPLYQDDPTLPNGVVKQVEHPAWGANVTFSRTVSKNGKVIIADTFNTSYQPWRAVYLRGTM